MLDGRLISTFMPGASTEAASTGFNGIFACLTPIRGIFMPPTMISGGGGEEHSWSLLLLLQETASCSCVAKRRDKFRSGLPLSIQARTRCVEPSGSGSSALMTARL